jgi:hypothetical protein
VDIPSHKIKIKKIVEINDSMDPKEDVIFQNEKPSG